MNREEIHQLARAVAALRPDWQAYAVRPFLEQNFPDVALHEVALPLLAVALELNDQGEHRWATPGVVLESGPWWDLGLFGGGGPPAPARFPPKRDQECTKHPGEWAHLCRACASERIGSEPTYIDTRRRTGVAMPAEVRHALRGRPTDHEGEHTDDT